MSSLALLLSRSALALPITQNLPGPAGQAQTGSNFQLGMSRSRYVLFNDNASNSSYIRDIKTQTTTRLGDGVAGFLAISPSGRYASYRVQVGATITRYLVDRVAQTSVVLPVTEGTDMGLSDNGYALFETQGQIVRYRIQDQTTQVVAVGGHLRKDPISADGQVAIFTDASGQAKIYNAATQTTVAFAPVRPPGIPMSANSCNALGGDCDLASSGLYVGYVAATTPFSLCRATLQPTGQTAVCPDLLGKFVTLSGGVSISANGRFATFSGYIKAGHPEWAAANAIQPDTNNQGYPRILRYDFQLDQLATMSMGFNGAPLQSSSGGVANLLPLVNLTTVVSDDGSLVEFSSGANNLLAAPLVVSAEVNYVAYVSNGFTRNYQFVDMPNTDTNFLPFARMTLVGNNQWEGTLTFDGVGAESFKFDAGGQLVNGTFTTAANWAINFGKGATAGVAVANGANIPVNGGRGTYKVTFNDQTLQYTFTKQPDFRRTVIFMLATTTSGQDVFFQGGIDHGAAASQLGLSCAANNFLCAIPIVYRNKLNPYTLNWKTGDLYLDWYGREVGQTLGNVNGLAQGSVADWSTNNAANANKIAINGVGYTPLNTWGDHYWMLDVDMDCSKTINDWFEVKSFISNGPGIEANVSQAGTPYVTGNHFGKCGQLNKFQRGNGTVVFAPLP